ncbi:MAG: Bifunctional NAD(P)H-hydrate repair enzyme Nnr [Anaerolineales bacterium]|nr:Bifunctional NAD(P)H-hydrate repair enzyme Nnr [Anaerolineales bacterium]
MKVVTAEEMSRIEKQADAGGLTYDQMMENAGQAVVDAMAERRDVAGQRVVILTGPGNNGGDGLVVGRHLHDLEAEVSVYLWKRETTDDHNFEAVEERDIPVTRLDEDEGFETLREWIAKADIVIDALLGTGLSRPIEGTLAELLGVAGQVIAERADAPWIVAVDMPTGIYSDTGQSDPVTVPADLTITFGLPKHGQFLFPAAADIGELVVDDIEVPCELTADVELELTTADTVADLLPARPLDAHKGTFGKALVVAGSVNYTGAAYLAAAAATRVGAGLVTAGLPGPVYPVVASKLSEATYLVLAHDMGVLAPGAVKVLRENIEGYDALLVGCGLTQEEATAEFLEAFLLVETIEQRRRTRVGFAVPGAEEEETEKQEAPSSLPPTVIDGDGLNILAKIDEWWKKLRPEQAILTPHPGEMSRLRDAEIGDVQADRIEVAREAAEKWGQIVVLKGAYTVIAAPDGRVTLNPFAEPALATAGSGDVLAGAIVGMLAQGLTPYDAAVAGCYLHGLAGQLVGAELGSAGAVAGDLLPALPHAIQELEDL